MLYSKSRWCISTIVSKRKRVEMDVAQLVKLPNGNQEEVMGLTPSFHKMASNKVRGYL